MTLTLREFDVLYSDDTGRHTIQLMAVSTASAISLARELFPTSTALVAVPGGQW